MGKQNNLWHDFLQDRERYADLINAFVMNGNQIVKPEDIKDADSKSRDKNRDEVRKVVFGTNFAMIGVESQETIDYSLVVRNMYYDAISYDNERKRICRANANSKSDLRDGELLYLFKKTDKLHPVVTFVVYCGKEPWDASKTLFNILDTTDIPKEILEYIPNYNINVIDVRRNIDRLSELRTDVRDVLEFIAYSDDLNKLKLLTASNTRYMNMKEDAYLLTKGYAHIDNLKPTESKKGAINMCKALEDLRIESINIGKILARYEDGMSIQDIAEKTGQTVDFIKDTLRENNLIEK